MARTCYNLITMPDLPTITVTTEQQARILAALKYALGTTDNAEVVRRYKKWLAGQIKAFVLESERRQIQDDMNTKEIALRQSVDTVIDETVF